MYNKNENGQNSVATNADNFMKAIYKEYVVIGNAGHRKETIELSNLKFNCTRDEFNAIANSFETEVRNLHFTNTFRKMLRDNPNDPAIMDSNMKSVVTEYYDSNKEVWKRTIKYIRVFE